MPFITPSEAVDTYAPHIVYLPVETPTGLFVISYAAIFTGAMLDLTYAHNYEQVSGQTAEYAANAFRQCYDLTFPLQVCP